MRVREFRMVRVARVENSKGSRTKHLDFQRIEKKSVAHVHVEI
jgi:hypothetical protein